MARKSPRPYWLFVTEVVNILGILKGRAHEAASHDRPDRVEKKEIQRVLLCVKGVETRKRGRTISIAEDNSVEQEIP